MALLFGTATSDRVDFNYAGSITDATIVAFGVWIRPNALANAKNFASKNFNDGNGGPLFRTESTTGDLRFQFNRAVANAAAVSSNAPIVTINKWYCAWGVYDPADTQPRIYVGSENTPLQEVTYAGGATQGSGAITSTAKVRAGNQGTSAGPATAFLGDISYFTYLEGRVPSLTEMTAWQFNPTVLGDAKVFAKLGEQGPGQVWDKTGLGNMGTITGAMVDNLFPQLRTKSRRMWWDVPVVAGTVNRFLALLGCGA